MALYIILFILGLIFIVAGGNFFVDAAVWLSEKFRVPKFIIGATIVSMATTMPELVVSIIACINGKYEMAAGNAIGSIVANIGLILSIGILAIPCEVKKSGLLLKSFLLLVAAIITFVFSLNGQLGYLPAVFLLLIWLCFMIVNSIEGKRAENNSPSLHAPVTIKESIINVIKFGFGAAALIFGSSLLVNNGSAIALSIGVPESIIAVTIVAIGTSLPELVTTITSICKKQSSLSVGNIIGANIMNIAFIMPICSLISGGIPIKAQTLWLDLPICALLTLIGFTLPSILKKYSRKVGIALFTIYLIYLCILIALFI